MSGGGGGSSALEIPDKLYFRIGEVARLCGVPAYVLRFWESEFPQLKPNKGGTGQRLYRRRDVEMALRIKTLLYDEGYTITGARQAFRTELRAGREAPAPGESTGELVDASYLRALQKELRELLTLLQKPAAPRSTVRTMRPVRGTPSAAPQDRPAPASRPLKPQLLPSARTPSPFLGGLFDETAPEE